MLVVKDLVHLRKLIAQGKSDYRIVLSGGVFSRKFIQVNKRGEFVVLNSIDDSTQVLNDEQMMDREYTNIGHACALSSLICEL